MRHLLTILAALFVCAAPAQAQTLKSLMYNSTNGQVVANTGTNVLTFPFYIRIADGAGIESTYSGTSIDFDGEFLNLIGGSAVNILSPNGIGFIHTNSAGATRTNLGLGATNSVFFGRLIAGATNQPAGVTGDIIAQNGSGEEFHINSGGFTFYQGTNSGGYFGAEERLLGGGDWNVESSLTIRQTTATNGLLFIRRTNNEPFLGLANLIASNNVTVSNETLFRVGVAEATNKAAQFGFRSTNTNGNGVAVFSVFGFNALMMVGADASTNAVIYSGGGTNNEVMTLIRDGATEFARPLRFSTNASTRPSTNPPTVTTNVAAWVEMRIGTNSYRVPLYQ